MAKEVKKSTYKKAKSARTTSISQTQWKTNVAGEKGKAGRLYGPGGKRFTGTVKLGNGKTAVYKQGKRVTRSKTAGGGYTGYRAPASSDGRAKTSTTAVPEDTKLPSGGKTAAERATFKPGKIGGYQAGASYTSKQGGSASGSAEGAHAAMAASRKEFSAQTSRARSRQSKVKTAGLYGIGVANPATRMPTILTGAAHAGYQFGKNNRKPIRRIINAPSRWWRGY